MFGLLVAGAAAGAWRYVHFPLEHENLAIVFGWNMVNLLFMLGALGVVYERKQLRAHPRVPRSQAIQFAVGGVTLEGAITDLSTSGAQIVLAADAAIHGHLNSALAVVRTALPGADGLHELNVQVRHAVVHEDRVWLGVSFTPASDAEQARLVQLCFGSSQAWINFQRSRQRERSILGGLVFFASLSLYHGFASLFAALRQKADPAGAAELLAPAAPRGAALQIGGDD
jgi:cellulose synthase (UDP-forming)